MKAAFNGEGQHHQHINDYCDYADATAEAAADDVRRDIPEAVQKEVSKQVGKRQVGIEIDKQSLKKAKAINSNFSLSTLAYDPCGQEIS